MTAVTFHANHQYITLLNVAGGLYLNDHYDLRDIVPPPPATFNIIEVGPSKQNMKLVRLSVYLI